MAARGGWAGGRSSLSRSLEVALLTTVATAAAVCGIEVALFLDDDVPPQWAAVGLTIIGAVYVATGCLAWRRRPGNRMGALLVAGGYAWLASSLVNTAVPALVAAGLMTATVPLAVLLHLLLAFPSGRLRVRGARVVVVAGYVVAVVLQAPLYLFSTDTEPHDVLALVPDPRLAGIGGGVQSVAGASVMVATTMLLTSRLRAARPPQRHVLLPLFAYGIVAALSVPLLANVVAPLLGLAPASRLGLQLAVLVGVPVAFGLAVLRGGFARAGDIEELGTWLGSGPGGQVALAQALATALGDPSLRLLFWAPTREAYLDADGRTTEPETTGSRACAEIELRGRRVGAIEYDATLIADTELVRTAGHVVAIAVDRDRLTAELLAMQEALRASRARIVEAGDRERRRIARNLHDGLQVRLVLLALEAQRIAADPAAEEAAVALRVGIDEAAAELRGLVHAVMPAALVERGLAAATEDLVDRVPLRTLLDLQITDGTLSPVLESTAYFVVAEGLANALKHSRATTLAVRLRHAGDRLAVEIDDDGVGGATPGAGLRGLADRVDVLGGRMHVDSPEGCGTRLRVELPCAS